MTRFIATALLFGCIVTGALAQEVKVQYTLDPQKILIGEWMEMELEVLAPSTVRVLLPKSDADFTNGAFVSADSLHLGEEEGIVRYKRDYIVTVFDTGTVAFSPKVYYFKRGDTTKYVATAKPVSVVVQGVKVDTAGEFKDIKDVMDVPLPWWFWLLLVAGLAGLAFLGRWLWLRYKNRPQPEPVPTEAPKPRIAAYKLALDRLHALEEKRWWEQGFHKEFQSELTDIVREYIENRFEIPALERTTAEIMNALEVIDFDSLLRSDLQVALTCADLTKFAKYVPDSVAHRQGLKTAYAFLEATKSEAEATHVRVHAEDNTTGEELQEQEKVGEHV